MHSGSVLAQALGCCSLTRVVQNQPERQNLFKIPKMFCVISQLTVIDIKVKIMQLWFNAIILSKVRNCTIWDGSANRGLKTEQWLKTN